MTVVTLYGKPGCCLCEDARAMVARARATNPFDLREVDVSTDPVLNRRYGERIPVIAIDGEDAFELRIDAEELRMRLGTVAE